jgi:hypothetical protein
MFVTGPPTPDGGGTPLRVHTAAGRTFGERTGQTLNPTMRGYVTDMAAPYGIAVHEDLIDQGAGHSYGEMCTPLLDELLHEDHPADLLVLATAVPDIRYGRTTATYLSWHCPGAPLAFTVCDQGLLAAFTALHLIAAYAHTGTCRRAVLLVAEQPTVYHELPVPTPLPARAAAVGVVLETGGPQATLSVHRYTNLAADEVPGLLGEFPGPVLVGANLAHLSNVLVCRENQPLTGIWLELSSHLPAWQQTGEQVLLAEYDPTQGQLFTATLRLGG